MLLAQTINSMDVLSGGRVALGVGVGDPSSDYAAYGGNLGERAGRSEEALEVIKKLWIEDSVTYNGRYFQLQDYTLLPRPTQKPHPPIYIGGTAEPVLRRTGRFANGLNPINQTPEQAAALFDRVEAYARQYGRDPSSMTRTLHIFMCLADSRKEADRIASEVFAVRYQTDVSPVADNPRLFGTPDEVSRHIQEFVDVGVTEFILNICYYPDQAISQAEIFAKEIMPQWR